MPRYSNLGGKSNVASYEIGEDEKSIAVTFGDGRTYVYTEASAGAANLRHLIELARAGRGLNGFITKVVKKGYASKS